MPDADVIGNLHRLIDFYEAEARALRDEVKRLNEEIQKLKDTPVTQKTERPVC